MSSEIDRAVDRLVNREAAIPSQQYRDAPNMVLISKADEEDALRALRNKYPSQTPTSRDDSGVPGKVVLFYRDHEFAQCLQSS